MRICAKAGIRKAADQLISCRSLAAFLTNALWRVNGRLAPGIAQCPVSELGQHRVSELGQDPVGCLGRARGKARHLVASCISYYHTLCVAYQTVAGAFCTKEPYLHGALHHAFCTGSVVLKQSTLRDDVANGTAIDVDAPPDVLAILADGKAATSRPWRWPIADLLIVRWHGVLRAHNVVMT